MDPNLDPRNEGPAAPPAVVEVWLTGPDEDTVRGCAGRLVEACDARVKTDAWNPLTHRAVADQPENPWTAVLAVPAATDPTLINAVVAEGGCCYHPDGGDGRWRVYPNDPRLKR